MDLNSLAVLGGGEYFERADAINELGQVVVLSNFGRAYLLSVSTVPEPGTAPLLLLGLAALVGWARRREPSSGRQP